MKRMLSIITILLVLQVSVFAFADDEIPESPSTPETPSAPDPPQQPDKPDNPTPGHGPGWGTAPSPPPDNTPLPKTPMQPIPNPQCHDDCPSHSSRGKGVSDYPDKFDSRGQLEKSLHNGDFFKEKGYGYDAQKLDPGGWGGGSTGDGGG